MKTYQEETYYRNLERKLKAHYGSQCLAWDRSTANLLGIGGKTPEIALRNKFNDPIKRFNKEQLELIHNELDNTDSITPFTQCSMQQELNKLFGKMGSIAEKITKHFDDKDEIELSEIRPFMKDFAEVESIATMLNQRAIETKENL